MARLSGVGSRREWFHNRFTDNEEGPNDREFNQLRDARAALRRIQEGSFGLCQECEDDIHSKRLAALPWALFCMRCQEAVDRNLGTNEAASRDLLGRAA
jgi:RNA polymerase-binding transcription factor DksA